MIHVKINNTIYPLFDIGYLKMTPITTIGFILLFIANALDIITTLVGISLGGTEANFLIASVVSVGILQMIIVKILMLLLVSYMLFVVIALKREVGIASLYMIVGLMIGIVLSNIWQCIGIFIYLRGGLNVL